ncbi:MAG: hypothetical protein HC818_00370 [Synechococcaceae cyanobacterium RM1_1_27]|nr:hypothetical protein [Synechococcaceae cyanobacterium RM1_1_27]
MLSSSPQLLSLSPLIRHSLCSLYGSLTLPLLLLLGVQGHRGMPMAAMGCAVVLGFVALAGALSQQTRLDQHEIAIIYPRWVPPLLQRRWQVSWAEITELAAVSTSQGGLAYYLVTDTGSRYLVPLRMSNLRHLFNQIEAHTGLDTQSVNPYVQPWMYRWLAIASGLMWICDLGLLALGIQMGQI